MKSRRRQLKRYTLSFLGETRMAMKKSLLTFLALACGIMFVPRAYGCSCLTPEVPEALKQAKAVFLGEVIDIVEPKTSNEAAPLPGRFFTIKFKIQRSWKGIPSGAREF